MSVLIILETCRDMKSHRMWEDHEVHSRKHNFLEKPLFKNKKEGARGWWHSCDPAPWQGDLIFWGSLGYLEKTLP